MGVAMTLKRSKLQFYISSNASHDDIVTLIMM